MQIQRRRYHGTAALLDWPTPLASEGAILPQLLDVQANVELEDREASVVGLCRGRRPRSAWSRSGRCTESRFPPVSRKRRRGGLGNPRVRVLVAKVSDRGWTVLLGDGPGRFALRRLSMMVVLDGDAVGTTVSGPVPAILDAFLAVSMVVAPLKAMRSSVAVMRMTPVRVALDPEEVVEMNPDVGDQRAHGQTDVGNVQDERVDVDQGVLDMTQARLTSRIKSAGFPTVEH